MGASFNYYGSLITCFGYLAFGVLLATWAAAPGRIILNACLIPLRAVAGGGSYTESVALIMLRFFL